MVDERYGAKGCKAYNDFREVLARDDIDAVVVATPDHWHVPISLAAIRAGKDVYCEKPLGLSIEQNKALRAAVHQYGAIFQYGTQQRSFSSHCGFACELVRNGYIGEIKAVHVVAPNGARGGDPTPQPVPEGLDYDLWLGPAPVTPYTTDRVIGGGRWYIYDYAIGFIAGWGAHPARRRPLGLPAHPRRVRRHGSDSHGRPVRHRGRLGRQRAVRQRRGVHPQVRLGPDHVRRHGRLGAGGPRPADAGCRTGGVAEREDQTRRNPSVAGQQPLRELHQRLPRPQDASQRHRFRRAIRFHQPPGRHRHSHRPQDQLGPRPGDDRRR